jgi:hypothetical protein
MKRLASALAFFLLLVAASATARAQGAPDASLAPDAGSTSSAAPADPASAPEPDEESEGELPEAHRPTLTLEVHTGEDGARTGDLVHVVITAEVPEGDDVAVPEQRFGSFELFDRRYTTEAIGGGRRRFRFELDLLALEPGEQELPSIRLRVVTSDGEVGTARTEARTITIGSHLANEPDAQPRPPTAPVQVFEEDYTLLWVLIALGAVLLVALSSFLVASWWNRRPRAEKPGPPPRPPWEVAIEKLETLRREKAGLLAQAKHVEFVDRVSDALREYLGGRYDFNGLESTTDEVITRLAKVKLRGVTIEEITALLADSDLVKFAKAVPDEAQCDRMLEGAVRIVRATTPRPEATPVLQSPVDGTGARIISETGEVTLPISAQTIEEAEREIRAAVGAAFRDVARDPSFEGTLKVVLSPELARSASATDALRRLHARLTSELETMPLPDGRRARLVIEHLHERVHHALAQGRTAARTIVDVDGVRSVGTDEVASSDATTPDALREEVPEPAKTASIDGDARVPEALGADARAAAAEPATGTATHARTRNEPVGGEPRPTESEPASTRGADLVSRLRPTFVAGDPPAGVVLRWVTGIDRPIAYAADGELLTTATMMSLGLTRGAVHDRALANLRAAIPAGFAPGDEPAVLDDDGAALLVLPELVPPGDAWLAFPLAGEGLVVMRERAASTPAELARLHRARQGAALSRPVRISKGGFAPVDWPPNDRVTDSGGGEP